MMQVSEGVRGQYGHGGLLRGALAPTTVPDEDTARMEISGSKHLDEALCPRPTSSISSPNFTAAPPFSTSPKLSEKEGALPIKRQSCEGG